MEKKLYRDETRKVIGGVCAGLADYFGIDVSIVRIVFLLTLILKGGGMLIYIVLWVVLPKKTFQFTQSGNQPFTPPYNPYNPTGNTPYVDYTVPPVTPPVADPQGFNQPKKRSTGSLIAGCILVLLGGAFILDDLNIIPDFDIEHFWPVILIAIGVIVIFSGTKKEPWEHTGWNKQDPDFNKQDNSTNNNQSTI